MSIRAVLLDRVLRAVLRRSSRSVADEIAYRRAAGAPQAAPIPAGVRRRFDVEETSVLGARVVRLRRRAPRSTRILVYLHGGGYAQPVTASHWRAVARYMRAIDADAILPLYRLAPIGSASQAHELMDEVVRTLPAPGPDAVVALAGDSSGAGLALAAAQRHPAAFTAAVLLNPWVDVECADPSLSALAGSDVILRIDELRAWGRVWAGELSTRDARVSPLDGRLQGLPPIHIVTGGRDLLLPDALRLQRRLRAAGNIGELHYAPDGNHAVGLTGAGTPEGRDVVRAVSGWLR